MLSKSVMGNPEALKPEALHTQAWAMVQPHFMQAQQQAAARYQQLAGTGQTSNDIQEAVVAASHGRVEQLFVAIGVQCWGSFSPETHEVHVHTGAEPGDDDLIDLTAIQTILSGGTVYAVKPEQVPGQALLAAVFRY